MMEIDQTFCVQSVRTREVFVPFRRPLATRIGMFEIAPFLLVDLMTDTGHIAHVPAFGFVPSGPELIGATIRAMAAPLIGKRVTVATLPHISDELTRSFMLLGAQGITRFAQSILDMALYDAMARVAEVPLYKLLGADPRPIRAYNSNGLGLIPPDQVADEARRLIDEGGFSHIKCRGGRVSASDDVAAVDAIRTAIGSNVDLSIDFNQGLSPPEAHQRTAALDDFRLLWMEEPVHSDNHILAGKLTVSLRTPVMMGENYYGSEGAVQAHKSAAFDLLMPDVLRIGGVTGWLRTAEYAARQAIPMSSHMSPEFSIHLMAATPTADWLEFVDWGAELIREPLRIDDGYAIPPDRPGSGIEWNETEINRHVKSDSHVS